eukprot:1159905-Pelagomonas_calceolata.AAC.2
MRHGHLCPLVLQQLLTCVYTGKLVIVHQRIRSFKDVSHAAWASVPPGAAATCSPAYTQGKEKKRETTYAEETLPTSIKEKETHRHRRAARPLCHKALTANNNVFDHSWMSSMQTWASVTPDTAATC